MITKKKKTVSLYFCFQVVFLLTGECGSTTTPEYQVYRQMAHATGGQIFRMMKDDVKDVRFLVAFQARVSSSSAIISKDLHPYYHRSWLGVQALFIVLLD